MTSNKLILIIGLLVLISACQKITVNVDPNLSRLIGNFSIYPPVMDSLSDETIAEGSSVTALDLNDGGDDLDSEGQPLTYSCAFESVINGTLDTPTANCSGLPGVVSFNTNTGEFTWTPNFAASGVYELWFTASDGTHSDTKVLTYTITQVNQSPVLDTVPSPLTGYLSAALPSINLADGSDDSDFDGDALTYSCSFDTTINGSLDGPGTNCTSLPGTVTFNSASGLFDWTPSSGATGIYEVLFTASDGTLTDSQLVTMTIEDNTLGDFNIAGITGGGDVIQDNKLDYITFPIVSWSSSSGAASYDVQIFQNDGITLVSCGSASGITTTSYNFSTCSLTPGTDYKVRVSARTGSGGGKNSENDLFNFRLNNVPVAMNDGPYYVWAGSNITVDVLADNLATSAIDSDTDPDGDPIAISGNTNGTKGTTTISGSNIVYTTTATQGGLDTFTYTISDGRGGTDTGTVMIYVIKGFSWIGAINSDWNNPGNWCGSINSTKTSCSGGSSLPGPADVVQFNSSCINCNVNINTTVSVKEITLDSDFTGTITQNANQITVTTGWIQNSGVFVGGSADINVDSFFRVNGGSFTSTTGTFKVYRNQGCCGATTDTFLVNAAATFAHNNGTVHLRGSSSNSTGGTVTAFQINAPDVIFHNLIIDGHDAHTSSGSYSTHIQVKAGQKIKVLNKLTQMDGGLTAGMIDILGDAEFTCISPEICSDGGASVGRLHTELNFIADFPIVQNLIVSGNAKAPSINISGTGSVNVISDTNDLMINGNFKQTSGTFTAPPGWIKVWGNSINCCSSNTEGFRLLGGTFNDNGFSLYLNGINFNTTGANLTVGVLQVPLGFTVRNFHFDHTYYDPGSKWDFGITNIINVTEDFIHSDGLIYGTPSFNVAGDLLFECLDVEVCAENSNYGLTLNGAGTQFVTQDTGAGIGTGLWTVNKPSGSVDFITPLSLNGDNQDFDLVAGVINMNGFNFTVQDGTSAGNILSLGPNTVINRGPTPGIIDTDSIVQDPTSVINPP